MTNVRAASGRARSDDSRALIPIRSRSSDSSMNGDGPAVDEDGERVVVGRRIALVEGVDPFLDPHAGGIGHVAVGREAPGDRVRGGVDVHRERGIAVLVGVGDRVDAGSSNVTPS